MKFRALILGAILMIVSCKNKTTSTVDYSKETLEVITSAYPENISKVFDANGGIDKWELFEIS